MEPVKKIGRKYFSILDERSKKSRVYTPYQSTGLLLAQLLNDEQHKTLYMKLAKKHDNDELIRMAKNLAERKDVKNRGAYFMKILQYKNSEVRNKK